MACFTVIGVFLTVCVYSSREILGAGWFRGCFYGNARDTAGDPIATRTLTSNTIGSKCDHKSYLIIKENTSECLSSLDALLPEMESPCSNRRLPMEKCDIGGLPVYSVNGPAFDHVHIHNLDGKVVQFETVLLTAEVITQVPKDYHRFLGLSFMWRHLETNRSFTECLPLNKQFPSSTWLLDFQTPGTQQIAVTVTSGLETMSSAIELEVLRPLLDDVRMVHVRRDEEPEPSCVPVSVGGLPAHALATVLSGAAVTLKATIRRGHEVNFSWWFGDSGASGAPLFNRTRTHLKGMEQRFAQVEHVFKQEGVFTVRLDVTSAIGFATIERPIVVVPFYLRDIRLSVRPEGFVFSVSQLITFDVQLQVTSLDVLTLSLDLGDGEVRTLEDSRGSYDDECIFRVSFQHMYETGGSFTIIARAVSDMTNDPFRAEIWTSTSLKVDWPLEHVAVWTKSIHAASALVGFSVDVFPSETLIYVDWRVVEVNSNHSVNVEGTEPEIQVTFPCEGIYTVSATVKNSLGQLTSEVMVNVQAPITGLKIEIEQIKQVYSLGDVIYFLAKYDTGSDVKLTWDVNPNCKTHVEKTTYNNFQEDNRFVLVPYCPGHYDVIARATNDVSDVSARVPVVVMQSVEVTGLVASTLKGQRSNVLKLGEKVMFCALLNKGSDVEIEFYFDSERILGSRSTVADLIPDSCIQWTAQHVLSSAQRHLVKAVASNAVSMATTQIEVRMSATVTGRCSLRAVPQADTTLQLLAYINDEISNRDDIFYCWKFSNDSFSTSTCSKIPFITVDKSSSLDLTVNLTVHLIVHSQVDDCSCSLSPGGATFEDPPLLLPHAVVVRSGVAVLFSLDVGFFSSLNSSVIKVKYSENETKEEILDEHGSWNHVFSHAGVYSVHVFPAGVGGLVAVQVPLSRIHIRGPKFAALSRSGVVLTFKADCDGSHRLFTWTVENVTIISSAPELFYLFTKTGKIILSLQVTNGLGGINTSHLIDIVRSLSNLTCLASPAQTGEPTTFNISIISGEGFNLSIHFGDGGPEEFASWSEIPDTAHNTIQMQMNHTFAKAGIFLVSVIATSRTTVLRQSVVVVVEDYVKSVYLNAILPRVIALPSKVTFIAGVNNGTVSDFLWDFGDSNAETFTYIISNRTTSIAHHQYALPGMYQVEVTAKNTRSFASATLPNPLLVVEPIQNLTLPHAIQDDHVILYESDTETDPVEFRAQVIYGSHLEFEFDYGDGFAENFTVNENKFFSPKSVIRNHVYTSEGEYNLTVKVSNPLGYLKSGQTVFVCRKTLELGFLHRTAVILLGHETSFRVLSDRSPDLFDWWLDNKLLRHRTGSEITVRLNDIGVFTLTAKVVDTNGCSLRNPKYGQESILIRVQDLIQNVFLEIENLPQENKLIFSSDDPVAFKATVFPMEEIVDYYVWNISNQKIQSSTPYLLHQFQEKGRIIISLTAVNHFNLVTSEPIEVIVIEKLKTLQRIRHPTSTTANTTLDIHAEYWFGSNLTFLWDFGDGSPKVQTLIPHVKHSFSQNGEYVISLFAWNRFSSKSLTSHIFVLEEDCEKPLITFVPSPFINFPYGTPVYIEPEIKFRCAYKFSLIFDWKVYDDNISVISHEQASDSLILLGNILQPGNYTVKLKISVMNTILYGKYEVHLTISPPPFLLHIIGGTSWTSSRKNTIKLNSLTSRQTSKRLKYHWNCQISEHHKTPCFGNFDLDMNEENLTFPGPWLRNQSSHFLFTLTASNLNESVSETQILRLKDSDVLYGVKIECARCKDSSSLVTKTSEVSLKVIISGQDLDNISVNWQLWLVKKKHHFSITNKHCVMLDGVPSFINLTNDNKFDLNTDSNLNDSNSNFEQKQEDLSISTLQPLLELKHKDNTLLPPSHIPIEEGSPGDSGSASARNHGQIIQEADLHFQNGSTLEKSSLGLFPSIPKRENDSLVINPMLKISKINHIFRLPREEVDLKENDTVFGTTSEYFILKPNVLNEGMIYLAEVIVKKIGLETTEWTASQAIEVLSGPMNGRCFISPSQGIELITEFTVDCLEWTSEYLPIFYQITYSTGKFEEMLIIYHGIKPNVKFRLPAGRWDNNYNVHVGVKLFDSSGASINVCDTMRKIIPLAFGKNVEDFMYNELFNSSSDLSHAFAMKKDYHTLQILRILTMILNREPIISLLNRKQIRTEFAMKIHNFTHRTQFELLQVLSVINLIIAKPLELHISTVDYLLTSIEIMLKEWFFLTSFNYVHQDEHHFVIIDTLSNLLQVILSRELSQWNPKFHQIISIIGNMLQKNCQAQFQNIVNWETKYITIMADCHCGLQMKSPNFRKLLKYSACCQIHRFIIKKNLLAVKNNSKEVHTPLNYMLSYSYTEHNCNKSFMVYHSKFHTKSKVLTSYPLLNSEMNLHEFYIDDNIYEDLIVTVNFSDNAVHFPIKLLFSYRDQPTPTNIFLNKILNGKSTYESSVYIKKSDLPGIGKYTIGILPLFLGNHRSLEGNLNYTLYVWWMQCLNWDWNTGDWSKSSCSVLNSTSMQEAHCRCEAGSIVASKIQFVSYNSSYIPLWKYYKKETEVSGIFIATVIFFVILFILAIPCQILSIQDNKKCKIMYLEDNSPFHSQAYIVSITTGHQSGSGTTASIYIILHGENGMSETRELKGIENEYTPFQRNSHDVFIISTSESLGPIWKVQIWHNNKGASPSWFLCNVTIRDINTDNVYFFECNKWFAVEDDDGHIEREILKTSCHLNFQKGLKHFLPQCFSNFHLWYSVYNPWPSSDFTRMQRLFCCFTYLALNAAASSFLLLNHHLNKENKVVLFHWDIIWIGFISTIVMKPFLIILSFFFMKTQVSRKIWCKFPISIDIIKEDSDLLPDNFFPLAKRAKYGSVFLWKYIGWMTSVLLMLVSIGFINLIQMNEYSILLWIEAVYFSWLLSFYIVEPFNAIIMAAWFSWQAKNNINFFLKSDRYVLLKLTWINITQTPSSDVSLLWSEEEELIARCKSRYFRSLRPPPEYVLIEERKKILKEKSVLRFLSNTVKCGLQVFFLIMITYQDSNIYPSVRYINTVVNRSFSNNIQTTNEWLYSMLYNFSPMNEFSNFEEHVSNQNSEYILIGGVRLKTFTGQKNDFTTSAFRNQDFFSEERTLNVGEIYFNRLSRTINLVDLLSPNITGITIEFNLWNVAVKIFSSVTIHMEIAGNLRLAKAVEIHSMQRSVQFVSVYDQIALVGKLLLVMLLLWELTSFILHNKFNHNYYGNIISGIKLLWLITCIIYIVIRLNILHENLKFTEELGRHNNQEYFNSKYYIRESQLIHEMGALLIFIAECYFLTIIMELSVFSRARYVIKNVIIKIPEKMVFLICLILTFLHGGIWWFGPSNKGFSSYANAVLMLFSATCRFKIFNPSSHIVNFEILYFFTYFITVIIFVFVWLKTILDSDWKQHSTENISMNDLKFYLYNKLRHFTSASVQTEKFSKRETPFFIEFHLQEMEHQIDEMFYRMNHLCDNELNDFQFTECYEPNSDEDCSLFHLQLMNWNNIHKAEFDYSGDFGNILLDHENSILLLQDTYQEYLEKAEDFQSSSAEGYSAQSPIRDLIIDELLCFDGKDKPENQPIHIVNNGIDLHYENSKINNMYYSTNGQDLKQSSSSSGGIRKQDCRKRPLRRTKSQGKGKGNDLEFDSYIMNVEKENVNDNEQFV